MLKSKCSSAAALTLMAVSGCMNDTNTLIGAGENPLPALVSQSPSVTESPQQPSVTGLDRNNWPLVTIAVPRGQVETRTNYLTSLHLSKGVARDTGEYPTTASALEGRSTNDSLFVEALIQPFWVPVMLVAAPVQRFSGAVPAETHGPTANFQLTPNQKPRADRAP